MVLAAVGALDSTRGRAVAQQASASYCKGVHPYNMCDVLGPYNSSPLASTDAINQLQGFMLFTHFANSAGLSRQCSKGPQDSLQEIS